jgi:dolichol-phosphate mannosyltransferase
MRRVLIVIPTYNEIDNIQPLVASIGLTFARQASFDVDILFIDDNSPDGTAGVITSLQTNHKNVYMLGGTKEGLGKAYIRGLTYGMGLKSYFAIVTMDADLSHDPKDIPRLLTKLESGADFVIGSRYAHGGKTVHGYPLFRRAQSTIANVIAQRCLGLKTKINDFTSGFRAMRVTSLSTIPLQSITASGYVFQVGLLYEFSKRNYKVVEVPITFRNRLHGASKLGYKDVMEFLYYTYRLKPRSEAHELPMTTGAVATNKK